MNDLTTTHIAGIPQGQIDFADHGEFYVRIKHVAKTYLIMIEANGVASPIGPVVIGLQMKVRSDDHDDGWGVTSVIPRGIADDGKRFTGRTLYLDLAGIKSAKILRPDYYEGRLVEVESVDTPFDIKFC